MHFPFLTLKGVSYSEPTVEKLGFLDQVSMFMSRHPEYIGVIFTIFGIILLFSTLSNAHWLFGDVNTNTYNLKKLDGWINIFGRKTARGMFGFVSAGFIVFGILWVWYFAFYK